MSINPVLAQDIHTKQLMPSCCPGEAMLLCRSGTKLTLKLANRTLSGCGDTFLTTHRIVFVKKQDQDFRREFTSISLPYALLSEPRFHQPIFKSNHFDGKIQSEFGQPNPLESDGLFSIIFKGGGCALFLKGFYMFYAKVHNDPSFQSVSDPFCDISSDRCAFIDPNDPSRVYFTQPQTAPVPGETTTTSNAEQDGQVIQLTDGREAPQGPSAPDLVAVRNLGTTVGTGSLRFM
ncbi:conserved hypothetical protein [Theileria equi strain WA]|uniref:GRAM domain-containing protein n=1 Tax=Theileria equi strain WA TaxID=1537102 RepID=L1LC54_THEEQ|nr:conserved hypothetical protein [Theileria equi strain WA]EKX72854.1 conserved hypothetical protein [Theileria equi strain WA]|eukprot:XP_004832306.1 conserved hypothetical protein [Theileria equi strain WA]